MEWSSAPSAGPQRSLADWGRSAAPVLHARTAPSRRRGADTPASDHLQSAAVHRNLRTGELDARANAVRDLYALHVHHDFHASRGFNGDAARAWQVVNRY